MSFTWDAENRLASVTLPGAGGTVSYQYDPFGRRIEKVSPTGTTIYAYDGANVVEELGGGCRKRHILRYLAHRIKTVQMPPDRALLFQPLNYDNC